LAIILYWFSNNIWTFAQQHYVFGLIAKEDEEKKDEALRRRAANAPAPGAKPKRAARPATADADTAGTADDAEAPVADVDATVAAESSDGQPAKAETAKRNPGRPPAPRGGRPGAGAKPKKRKR
jgi:YidC/Oxa1 family membrane protein insertase